MSTRKKKQAKQYLFQLAFDSPLIFRKSLYFNYDGIDFKLIKGTQKYQDTLCSIVNLESNSPEDFEAEVRRVEAIALRFLTCLSWEKRVGITNTPYGGRGWNKERGSLSRVPRRICSRIPRTFRNRRTTQITKLPNVCDNRYRALALSLLREARASNSLYYQFLCHWKVLEIYQRKKGKKRGQDEMIKWINDTIERNPWILQRAHFDQRLLENEPIGDYLCKEGRHAIAHVMPDRNLAPDSGESLSKIYAGNVILEYLVAIFIKEELELAFSGDKRDNYLYLMKRPGRVIPVFAPARLAQYRPLSLNSGNDE